MAETYIKFLSSRYLSNRWMFVRLKQVCVQWLSILVTLYIGVNAQYEPNWESLNSRPLPEWFVYFFWISKESLSRHINIIFKVR